jgi:hypothetical protein
VNPAAKHLQAKLRIGELTVMQWLGVGTGVLLAIGWGLYASPFGAYLTLVSSFYLGAIPASAAMLASFSEFDFWLLVRTAHAFRRADGRYLAGPGDSAVGYQLRSDAVDARRDLDQTLDLDLSTLWD